MGVLKKQISELCDFIPHILTVKNHRELFNLFLIFFQFNLFLIFFLFKLNVIVYEKHIQKDRWHRQYFELHISVSDTISKLYNMYKGSVIAYPEEPLPWAIYLFVHSVNTKQVFSMYKTLFSAGEHASMIPCSGRDPMHLGVTRKEGIKSSPGGKGQSLQETHNREGLSWVHHWICWELSSLTVRGDCSWFPWQAGQPKKLHPNKSNAFKEM